MSEFNIVEVQYKDEACLVASLEELGYKCDIHNEAKNLRGYQDDIREQKANLIIKKENIGSASNDIGFLRKKDGTYEMIISEYDIKCKHGKKFTETLKQIYGKNMTLKAAAKLGLKHVSTKTDEKGKIHIKIMDLRR